MQGVITAQTSAELDAASIEDVSVLMDRAGYAVALEAVRMGATYGSRVAVLAGSGNNGGDAYVAAFYLSQRGALVTMFPYAPPPGEAARDAQARAVSAGARLLEWSDEPSEEASGFDLVIDGLFGGGFHGRLHDRIVPWIDCGAPVLAIDVPSGVDASTGDTDGPAFAADRTVTFHAPKVGHFVGAGRALVGELRVVDIGLAGGNPEFSVMDEGDAPWPRRPVDAHKWSAGSVVVLGGSQGMTGAASLVAHAALSAGAGAVSIACNAANAAVYEQNAPTLLTPRLGRSERWRHEDIPALLEYASRFDVMVIGPGLDEQEDIVREVLARRGGRVLADASALRVPDVVRVIADRQGETIVTPHTGEFQAMTGKPGTYLSADMLASESEAVVVLKGWPTFVASSNDPVVAVTTPREGLATIGTGDVLAGVIGAFWAAGLSAPVAARSAAYWHGRAGSSLAARTTVTADRLIDEIATWSQ